MAKHPNVERLREAFEIRQRLPLDDRDRRVFDELLADDVIWHGTGAGPWGRDYEGKAAVFGLFDEMAKMSGGTMKVWPEEIYADDTHGVIIAGLKAEFGGRHLEWTEAQVFHLAADGTIKEFWGIPDEQEAVDAFFFGGGAASA
jgi:ketosteroid isomerase-like protein